MLTLQLVRPAHARPELIDSWASVVRCLRAAAEISINVIAIRARFCPTGVAATVRLWEEVRGTEGRMYNEGDQWTFQDLDGTGWQHVMMITESERSSSVRTSATPRGLFQQQQQQQWKHADFGARRPHEYAIYIIITHSRMQPCAETLVVLVTKKEHPGRCPASSLCRLSTKPFASLLTVSHAIIVNYCHTRVV